MAAVDSRECVGDLFSLPRTRNLIKRAFAARLILL